MVEDAHLAHASTIVAATYLTVGLSVLVHGLSAPLVSRYANWYRTAADKHPPCDGEQTDARAPNPRACHAAEQLTFERRPSGTPGPARDTGVPQAPGHAPLTVPIVRARCLLRFAPAVP